MLEDSKLEARRNRFWTSADVTWLESVVGVADEVLPRCANQEQITRGRPLAASRIKYRAEYILHLVQN
jgi:hypothetical protein